MNKIAIIILAVVIFIACQQSGNKGLTISATPNNPILQPTGEATCSGNKITAPLFIVQSFNVTWTGTGDVSIMSLELKTTSSGATTSSYSCTLSGDKLYASFPSENLVGSQILIRQGASPVKMGGICCGGVPLPSPVPDTFNIPVQVKLSGGIIDSSNNTTGRASATTVITVN